MLDENIIDIIFAVYTAIISGLFIVLYKKGNFLLLWLFTSIFFTIGNIIFIFRYYNSIYRLISNIFYFISALFLSSSIFQEYYQIFFNNRGSPETHYNGNERVFPVIFIIFSVALINFIQIPFLLYILIMMAFMTKIYLKIKSITHLFLLLAQIFTFLTLFFSVLHNFSIQGMWEIAYFMKLMLGGSLLATGLSAPTESKLHQSEEKFRTSYNRAEFYKDLFTHDINNILQSIQSALDLFAIYGKDLQDKKDFFDLIVLVHGQINRAANLVYNIKKLSEMDEKEYPLKEMDAWKCLKKSIDLIKKKYPHKKLKITLEHGAEKTLVKANELLFDVFKNILNNAIIHNKNEIIEITAKSHEIIINDSKYQKIEISDNGIGIHDAIKKKIFERATLKEKSITGTGLSLSLVKKIIESYKGEIWVENRIKEDYSKGSKVIILLPTK